MSVRALETTVTEALVAQQKKLVERVFQKQHGLAHDEYIRLNGEWWGLEIAIRTVREVVKKADI